MAASAWWAAVQAARAVVGALDAADGLGVLDEDGDGTWKLFEILLEKMPGQPIPVWDRNSADDNWRRVMLVVEEGASEGKLCFPDAMTVDEEDTPGGRVLLREGNHSVRSEFGMFYAVPKEVVEDAEEEEEEDAEEEEEEELPAATVDLSGDDGEEDAQSHEIVDKMRVMFNEKAMTVRTRDGTGDTAIAATKVRLVGQEPGDFQMLLCSDLKAGIEKDEVQVLTDVDDPEDINERPADVLRSDKHVTGTLYAELSWPFAGEREYDGTVYGAMQQQAMSTKLAIGDKVKCVQADGAECYAGPFIESWHSRQRRYTVLVWKRTAPGKGELQHCGLNGIQAVTPRVSMQAVDQKAMLEAISEWKMTNPKSAYNATHAALNAAAKAAAAAPARGRGTGGRGGRGGKSGGAAKGTGGKKGGNGGAPRRAGVKGGRGGKGGGAAAAGGTVPPVPPGGTVSGASQGGTVPVDMERERVMQDAMMQDAMQQMQKQMMAKMAAMQEAAMQQMQQQLSEQFTALRQAQQAPTSQAVDVAGAGMAAQVVPPLSSHAVGAPAGGAALALAPASDAEDVFVGRKRRRTATMAAAELAQLCAEEKSRATEERVQVAGRKAYLQRMLQECEDD